MPAKDRFKDLQSKSTGATSLQNEKLIDELYRENKKLRLIYEKVEKLNEQIDGIKGNTLRLRSALDKFYNTPRKEEHAEIRSLFDIFTKKSQRVSLLLKRFEEEVDNLKKTDTNEARIMKIQMNSLKKTFKDVVQENHDIIEKYHNYMRDMYKMSIKITSSNDINDDELEKMLDEKDMLQIFIDNHLVETEVAIKQLDELKSRHAQLVEIEEQIRDMHGLFMQISVLVEEQQESLDRVEYHAINTREYVEQGAVDIGKSNKHKTRKRKLTIWIAVAVIILIIILLIILFK